jgi:hypothetical protein
MCQSRIRQSKPGPPGRDGVPPARGGLGVSCLRRLWLLLRRVRYKRSKIFNDSSVSRANTLLRGVCKALKRSIAVHSDVPPLLPQQRTTKPYRLPKESVGGITQYVAFSFSFPSAFSATNQLRYVLSLKFCPSMGQGGVFRKGLKYTRLRPFRMA